MFFSRTGLHGGGGDGDDVGGDGSRSSEDSFLQKLQQLNSFSFAGNMGSRVASHTSCPVLLS